MVPGAVDTPGGGSASRVRRATVATSPAAGAAPRAKKGPPPSALATVSSTTYSPRYAHTRANAPRAAPAAQVARQRSAGAGGYGMRTRCAASTLCAGVSTS